MLIKELFEEQAPSKKLPHGFEKFWEDTKIVDPSSLSDDELEKLGMDGTDAWLLAIGHALGAKDTKVLRVIDTEGEYGHKLEKYLPDYKKERTLTPNFGYETLSVGTFMGRPAGRIIDRGFEALVVKIK